MTQPIGSGAPGRWQLPYENEFDQTAEKVGLAYCRNASTVVAGSLCDEPTAVSNACRSPRNDFDAFVCDDTKMAGLQSSLREAAKDVLKMAASVVLGRMP
jgi:hypothetical protein